MSDVRRTVRRSGPRLPRGGRLLLVAVLCVLVVLAVLIVPRLLRGPQPEAQLTVPEGRRAAQVYAAADKALHLPEGTTAKAARTAHLHLPAEAKGNPEGYLFPATYP